MATIEQKSYEAIKENIHMLSIITKERIWEEIVKGFKQSKRFSNYMNILYDIGAFNVIFTNLNIKVPLRKDTSLEMHFAYLFMENATVGLLDKMKFEFKIPHDFSRKVVFLLDLIYLTPEKALDLHKKKVISGTTNEELLEWYELAHLHTSSHKAFLQYEPSVSGDEIIKKGFKGKALGDEIKRLELENFKQLLNEVR